ncbi:hypothetical protein SDC9_129409 [bioreactor metagenome]|uniref:Uncharacterized protein n=1 Tax=bioreactor metagenome TaxID=1076179 RepID=A0A645CZR8_9ZZZZ
MVTVPTLLFAPPPTPAAYSPPVAVTFTASASVIVPPLPEIPPPMPAPLRPPVAVTCAVSVTVIVPPLPAHPPPMPAPYIPPVAVTWAVPATVIVPPLPLCPPPMPALKYPPATSRLPRPAISSTVPLCTCTPGRSLPLFSVFAPASVRVLPLPVKHRAQAPDTVLTSTVTSLSVSAAPSSHDIITFLPPVTVAAAPAATLMVSPSLMV